MHSVSYYDNFQKVPEKIKYDLLEFLLWAKSEHKKVVSYGAAAKGNTFLNYCGIRPDIIEAVIDETPYKIGKYLPQSKIPILPFSEIKNMVPDIIVILPWNHKEEILDKLKFTKEWGCKIVVFIPKMQFL